LARRAPTVAAAQVPEEVAVPTVAAVTAALPEEAVVTGYARRPAVQTYVTKEAFKKRLQALRQPPPPPRPFWEAPGAAPKEEVATLEKVLGEGFTGPTPTSFLTGAPHVPTAPVELVEALTQAPLVSRPVAAAITRGAVPEVSPLTWQGPGLEEFLAREASSEVTDALARGQFPRRIPPEWKGVVANQLQKVMKTFRLGTRVTVPHPEGGEVNATLIGYRVDAVTGLPRANVRTLATKQFFDVEPSALKPYRETPVPPSGKKGGPAGAPPAGETPGGAPPPTGGAKAGAVAEVTPAVAPIVPPSPYTPRTVPAAAPGPFSFAQAVSVLLKGSPTDKEGLRQAASILVHVPKPTTAADLVFSPEKNPRQAQIVRALQGRILAFRQQLSNFFAARGLAKKPPSKKTEEYLNWLDKEVVNKHGTLEHAYRENIQAKVDMDQWAGSAATGKTGIIPTLDALLSLPPDMLKPRERELYQVLRDNMVTIHEANKASQAQSLIVAGKKRRSLPFQAEGQQPPPQLGGKVAPTEVVQKQARALRGVTEQTLPSLGIPRGPFQSALKELFTATSKQDIVQHEQAIRQMLDSYVRGDLTKLEEAFLATKIVSAANPARGKMVENVDAYLRQYYKNIGARLKLSDAQVQSRMAESMKVVNGAFDSVKGNPGEALTVLREARVNPWIRKQILDIGGGAEVQPGISGKAPPKTSGKGRNISKWMGEGPSTEETGAPQTPATPPQSSSLPGRRQRSLHKIGKAALIAPFLGSTYNPDDYPV
jgi:hypothetical protein